MLNLKELEKRVNSDDLYKNLESLSRSIYDPNDRELFLSKNEHYRLLAAISEQIGSLDLTYDIGTYKGLSALALSFKSFVISYDIQYNIEIERPNNIEFRIGNFYHELLILRSRFVMFDIDPHDGEQEKLFFSRLKASNFDGYVLFDDILLNDEMKKFWASIDMTKYDLTHIGHWSGSGLVDFTNR